MSEPEPRKEEDEAPLTGSAGDAAVPMQLRAEALRVTRLSRKVLAGIGLVASVGIGGALIYALQTRDAGRPADELYSTDNRPTADGLAGLPRDYSGVPQLGPPLPGPPPALVFGAGQIVAPGEVVVAVDLGINEAVDGLVADRREIGIVSCAARDLLGRPSLPEAVENVLAQGIVAVELAAGPSPGPGLLLGEDRFVGVFGGAVALQLAGDRRRLAIQSCSDLPDRAALAT